MSDGESLKSWQARAETLKARHNNGNGAGMPLAVASQLVGWMTPKSTEHQTTNKRGNPTLNGQALGVIGESSSVETKKPVAYRLNPLFSLWLMLGDCSMVLAWASCGVQAIASCRKSRRRL
jgi:hypothetical protein